MSSENAGVASGNKNGMTDQDWARWERYIASDWWTVTRPCDRPAPVLVTPAQTQREMLALYPGCVVESGQ